MKKQTLPKWITARLGDDLNWWLDEVSSEVYADDAECGLLDPRQITYLLEALEPYQAYGYRHELMIAAFQLFHIESEVSEDQLRLSPTVQDAWKEDEQLFALPLHGGVEMGAYGDFLDAITAAHIRKLNATHHYARACTELELQEELGALDRDRYFASENIHTFDEINEILQWSPAEWDDSSAV